MKTPKPGMAVGLSLLHSQTNTPYAITAIVAKVHSRYEVDLFTPDPQNPILNHINQAILSAVDTVFTPNTWFFLND